MNPDPQPLLQGPDGWLQRAIRQILRCTAPLGQLLPIGPWLQRAIRQILRSTAHLGQLLPTGALLAFQLLSPLFTNQGKCGTVGRYLTAVLLTLCGLSSILLSFTDSFRDAGGNPIYGFATIHGLWVIGGGEELPQEQAEQYKLRGIDFVYAFASALLFAAVALFDDDAVKCFVSSESDETERLLKVLSVVIGACCSTLFVAVPSRRNRIGYAYYAGNQIDAV